MSKCLLVSPKHARTGLSVALLAMLSACGGGGGDSVNVGAINSPSPVSLSAARIGHSSLTVQVSVAATDPNGRSLHYRWRSTDGSINDVDSASTTWNVTDGPGVHFAYVLVSNGAGGYTERRAVLNTDTIGTPILAHAPAAYSAPAAPFAFGFGGETYRTFVRSDAYVSDPSFIGSNPNVADIPFFMQDSTQRIRFPSSGVAVSDLRGQLVIPGMLPVDVNDPVQFLCKVDVMGNFTGCGTLNYDAGAAFSVPADVAVTDYLDHPQLDAQSTTPIPLVVGGQIHLADGSPCGTVNEFFGIKTTGRAVLVDAGNHKLGVSARLSADGAYILPYNRNAVAVVLRCEGAPAKRIAISGPGGSLPTNFAATGQPLVNTMTVTLNGTIVGSLLPPPTGVPSDVAPDPERFLSYKGIDSLQDACAYYKAIGAARGCDSQGKLIDPITFDDWMRTVKIGKYAVSNVPEYSARYINKADLNLARNHHSISYGPNHSAAYVCNHLGPKVLDPDQKEIDSVIDTMVQGKNLVACVAMDYSPTPGVNGGAPFVRFLTFGPNGQLLPSVNLDGRREKYVPGTCVACHGGDHYAGYFTANGQADVGAHFLPYDPGNFEFSSKPGLTELDQNRQIYGLNQVVLQTNATVAARELIAGWYAGGGTAVDKNYLPVSWRGLDQVSTDFYREVVARSCRGCHVNLASYNFDHYDNITTTPYRGVGPDFIFTVGCNGGNSQYRSHAMPNSLVTFNRFWLTAGTTVDQPALLNAFDLQSPGGQGNPATLNCTP